MCRVRGGQEPASLVVQSVDSACNAGDPSSIPGSEDSLEKKMATHSSILDWEIPWTEKPDGLQSMGSQRVGHNSVTNTHTHTHTHTHTREPGGFKKS